MHSLTEARGQVQFYQNLIENLLEKGGSPYTKKIPDLKIKRQLLDRYLKGICSLTSQNEVYTIEIRSPNAFRDKYLTQTDDVDIEFSKVFTQYIKSIQHQNSQRANSTFTNNVFSLIYSYLSILELKEPQSDSPTQTSRHTTVRQEIHIFSKFLNAIREDLTSNDITQHVKHDLQKILAWLIIDYFSHNIDLIAQARKLFRPQNTDDETVLVEQSDNDWDPEWCHELFIKYQQIYQVKQLAQSLFTKIILEYTHLQLTQHL